MNKSISFHRKDDSLNFPTIVRKAHSSGKKNGFKTNPLRVIKGKTSNRCSNKFVCVGSWLIFTTHKPTDHNLHLWYATRINNQVIMHVMYSLNTCCFFHPSHFEQTVLIMHFSQLRTYENVQAVAKLWPVWVACGMRWVCVQVHHVHPPIKFLLIEWHIKCTHTQFSHRLICIQQVSFFNIRNFYTYQPNRHRRRMEIIHFVLCALCMGLRRHGKVSTTSSRKCMWTIRLLFCSSSSFSVMGHPYLVGTIFNGKKNVPSPLKTCINKAKNFNKLNDYVEWVCSPSSTPTKRRYAERRCDRRRRRWQKEEELYLWLSLFVTNNFVLHKFFNRLQWRFFKKCSRCMFPHIVMGECVDRLRLLHPDAHTLE